MFNLQGSELVIILLLALVVLGPEKLPDAMRKIGQVYAELKKMSTGFQSEFKAAIDEPLSELKNTANTLRDSADFTKLQAGERSEKPKSADMVAAPDPDDVPTEDLPFMPEVVAGEAIRESDALADAPDDMIAESDTVSDASQNTIVESDTVSDGPQRLIVESDTVSDASQNTIVESGVAPEPSSASDPAAAAAKPFSSAQQLSTSLPTGAADRDSGDAAGTGAGPNESDGPAGVASVHDAPTDPSAAAPKPFSSAQQLSTSLPAQPDTSSGASSPAPAVGDPADSADLQAAEPDDRDATDDEAGERSE